MKRLPVAFHVLQPPVLSQKPRAGEVAVEDSNIVIDDKDR